MKLTNAIRDAFVRAVMNDVPQVDYVEQVRTEVYKKAVERLPQAARALWEDPKTKPFVVTGMVHVGGRVRIGVAEVPGFDGGSWNTEMVGAAKGEQEAFFAQFDELIAKRDAQDEHRAGLESKLRAVAYSCTTRKALLERLPEFEKYLPEEDAKSTQLPAVANLVAELTQAGWPKGSEKEVAKIEEAAAA